MHYISKYNSPIGKILLASDEIGMIGVWFEEQKYYAAGLCENPLEQETDVLKETKRWLDMYFSGKIPKFAPPIHFIGTPFQISVWEILKEIPYGKTITYGEIASKLSCIKGLERAVGGAVGHNKISIIIPCHRVLGAGNTLTGYAAGIERKKKLLTLEGVKI